MLRSTNSVNRCQWIPESGFSVTVSLAFRNLTDTPEQDLPPVLRRAIEQCASSEGEVSIGYELVLTETCLELHDRTHPAYGPVSVSLPSWLGEPNFKQALRSQPLVRALGKHTNTVVDTTAGMGQDSFLLAATGHTVMAIERSPIVAALLEDGLSRLCLHPVAREAMGDRITLRLGDASEVLAGITPAPDAVYLDPMYPEKKKKSALARKEMQVLRELVGDDTDAAGLFEVSRRAARNRVVVKRPHYAPPLSDRPDMSYSGKLVRYDVYLNHA